MRSWNRLAVFTLLSMSLIAVAGCGGGGKSTSTATATYTIGGTITGLTGTGLVLQDNSGNKLTVSANATSYAFTFDGPIPSGGASYSITVLSNPAGQACVVSNPIGTATANVANAYVSCTSLAAVTYTVGGTISGHTTGSGLILQADLGINNEDLLPVSENGSFTFAHPVASGDRRAAEIYANTTNDQLVKEEAN